MNHFLYFSNGKFDLNMPESDIIQQMQLVSDYWMQQYYGAPVGTIKRVSVLDADTCEFEIERSLSTDACCAAGPRFIGEYDESLITGLEKEFFSLHPGSSSRITPIVRPLVPMGMAFYTPDMVFANVYKHLAMRHHGEQVQRVKFNITTDRIIVYVKYARTASGNSKRYADDVHDLEMELGSPLTAHRGETLEWQLWEIGEICARKYLKKQSYQGLVGYLKKTYDIDLVIK